MDTRLALSLVILSTSTLSAGAAAQTPPCVSFNTGPYFSSAITSTPFIGQNPGQRAYQFTPPTTVTVQAGSIFTASPSRNDFMRLEVWDDNPVGNQPMNRLCVGTMASPMSATPNWLGTNFGATPTLTAGTKYWLVWVEPGSSIIAEDPTGYALPRRSRSGTGAWRSLLSGAAKFQLFCNPLDAAGVTSFGAPCQTSAGQLAMAFTNTAATAGNPSFALEGTNFRSSAPVLLVIGVNPAWPSVPLGPQWPMGCNFSSDIALTLVGVTGAAQIGDQPPSPRPAPLGHLRVPLPMTGFPIGAFFAVQIYGFDSGATTLITAVSSNAVRITTQ